MKQLMVILISLFILSCNQQKSMATESNSTMVDSTMSSYVANPNNKDSVGIINPIEDDAIVTKDSLINMGIQNNAGDWLEEASKYFVPLKLLHWLKSSLFY
jgi:hypothetical protein